MRRVVLSGEVLKQHGDVIKDFVTYHDDGTFDIGIRCDDAQMLHEVPAPMMSEIERQELIQKFRDNMAIHGYWIESEWRVRNSVFDKRGEKTTTEFTVRPCRTKDEAEYLGKKIGEILGLGATVCDMQKQHSNASR